MSRRLESLVADIADDASVDWEAAKGRVSGGDTVDALRVVAAVGLASRRARASNEAGDQGWWSLVLTAVSTFALMKCALAVLITFTIPGPPRIGPMGLLSLILSFSASALIFGGWADVRARSLGSVFVLAAVAFVEPYLRRAPGGTWTPVVSLVQAATPEAFLSTALWFFAWVFPCPPSVEVERRVGRIGLALSATLATSLFVASGLERLLGPVAEPVRLFARYPGTLFWLSLALSGLPALGYLVWKSRRSTVEDRSRALVLSLGLAAGLAPFAAVLLLTPIVPVLSEPAVRTWIGAVLYVALASTVFTSAYAVAVRRVVDVHFYLRRALQHRLAKQLVWGTTLAPLVYVVAQAYLSRQLTVVDLATDASVVAMSLLGFGAATVRRQLLRGVDHWFRLGDVDYAAGLARFSTSLEAHSTSIRGLQETVGAELRRTVRARMAMMLVVNEARTSFVGLQSDVPPLAMTSSLVQLLEADHRGIHVDHEESGTFHLLPRADQAWVSDAGASWLFPVRSSRGDLIGLVSLGRCESGLPYADRDRTFTSALVGQAGLHLENLALRQSIAVGSQARGSSYPVWQGEPAMECETCRAVSVSADRCGCGSPLRSAAVPALLNDKFRIERVLGRGGMGVVYLAVDTSLKRRVAIKAIPKATPRSVARLQREAQAMALVRHPNLAMIFSVERWRDEPLLVVEYLEGGTLLDTLRSGPMAVEDALDLGIVLADALDRMHGNDVLHRDIKPSNIGFTAYGVPKLLDFGLAAMLQRADDGEAGEERALAASAAPVSRWSPHATRSHTQMVGTPMYVSPEAIAGDEPDESFDLWALSIVLYEAIAGRHPLAGYPADEAMRRIRSVRMPDVRDARAECPAPVAAFLNDALAMARERRPTSAAALRARLQSLRAGLEVSRPVPRSEHLY